MKHKFIKIDMDYAADPLWESEDGEVYCNANIQDFFPVLSRPLLHGLEVYRKLWETSHWSYLLSPTTMESWPGEDAVADCLDKMQKDLAQQLKKELPGCRVFYPEYDLLDKWVLVEVN